MTHHHNLAQLLEDPGLCQHYSALLKQEICGTDRSACIISGHIDYLEGRADFVDVLMMIDQPAIIAKGMQILINQYAPEEDERSIPVYSLEALHKNLQKRLLQTEKSLSAVGFASTIEQRRSISHKLDAAYQIALEKVMKSSAWRHRVLMTQPKEDNGQSYSRIYN